MLGGSFSLTMRLSFALPLLLFGCTAAAPAPRIVPKPIGDPLPTTTLRYEIVHSDDDSVLKTSVSYPHFSSNDSALAKALNDVIIPPLLDERRKFVEDYRESLRQNGPQPYMDNWEHDMKCEPTLVKPTVVSIVCDGYEFTGGAHGMPLYATETFTLDGDLVKRVNFSEMFSDPNKALAALDARLLNDLRAQEAPYVVDGEVTSVAEWFDSFSLEKKGVHFHYGPYQLGCYACGEFDVVVPYRDLADFTLPDSAIRRAASLD